MILSPEDLKLLDSALDCLYRDGRRDGDLGYLHRSLQIDLIRNMIKFIQQGNKHETDK